MATREQLYDALRNADAAGDVEGARSIASYIRSLPADDAKAGAFTQIPIDAAKGPARAAAIATPAPREDNLLGKVVGTIFETPLAIGTAAIAPVLAAGTGAAMLGFNRLTGNKDELMDRQGNNFADLMGRFTYQPTTQTARDNLSGIGKVLEASKLEGLMGMPILNAPRNALAAAEASNALRVPVSAAASATGNVTKNALGATLDAPGRVMARAGNAFLDKDAQMIGVGAAATPVELQRVVTARSLPVPINLTRGQASRDFVQQRFERETAKLPEGAPLRNRFAEQNQRLVQNLEQIADETGMQSPSSLQVGSAVDNALRQKIKTTLDEIGKAYGKAREAGHMEELIDISPLSEFLRKNRAASINAPILRSARSALKEIDAGGTRQVSINDLEELRKSLNMQIEPGTPNAHFGNQLITMIDSSTKGRGGQLYKDARAKYEKYASTFVDKDAVAKITRLKKGTTDRAVALESVFDHSVLRGSVDDLRAVQKALDESGEPGMQAWRELQGQTVRHIQDAITKSATLDTNGNRIVSPAELDRAVRSLDVDGKLDLIFGTQRAQQIRDINDVAKQVLTSPPGTVNSSNTATAIAMLTDMLGSTMAGVPLPIVTPLKLGRDMLRTRALKKKIDSQLNP